MHIFQAVKKNKEQKVLRSISLWNREQIISVLNKRRSGWDYQVVLNIITLLVANGSSVVKLWETKPSRVSCTDQLKSMSITKLEEKLHTGK